MSRTLPIALILLFVALVLRSEIVAAVAIALGAAVLLSRWWTRQLERALKITRHAPRELPFGDEATVTVQIDNPALVRVPWLEVRDSVALALRTVAPPNVVVTLGAGQRYHMQYTIRGTRRGWHLIGPVQLALGDVLGARALRLNVPASHVTVFPRIVPLAELGLPAALSYGPLVGQRTEDPARPAGVRAYVPGDDVRRLDWKSSARQSTLLVRRADATIAPETTIALAFGRDDYPARVLQDALERAVVAAGSLAVALLARKLPVGLVANGLDPQNGQHGVCLELGKGDGQRLALLRLLGRLSAGGDGNVFDLLQTQALPWGGTLALVMADLQLDDLPRLAALRRRGQQVALLLVEPSVAGLTLARQQRVVAYPIGRGGAPVFERGA